MELDGIHPDTEITDLLAIVAADTAEITAALDEILKQESDAIADLLEILYAQEMETFQMLYEMCDGGSG